MTPTQAGTRSIERVLERLCDISATVGGAVLIAIACMTVASVLGPAHFSTPILGDIELVQLGAAVVVASFLPYTQFQSANIIVDIFTTGVKARNGRHTAALGLSRHRRHAPQKFPQSE